MNGDLTDILAKNSAKELIKAQLILLPGFAADARVFSGLELPFERVEAVEYRWPVQGKTLKDYAGQLAGDISVGQLPVILCGYSMGGMIAQELLNIAAVPLAGAVLLASCRSAASIAPMVRLTGRVMSYMPLCVVRRSLQNPPANFKKSLGKHVDSQAGQSRSDLCREMMADSDAEFSRWAAGAIARWCGCNTGDMPVFHLHGSCDDLIRSASVMPDKWVQGAGHVSLLDYSAEVSGFITESARNILAYRATH